MAAVAKLLDQRASVDAKDRVRRDCLCVYHVCAISSRNSVGSERELVLGRHSLCRLFDFWSVSPE